jgi:hypothetical protein
MSLKEPNRATWIHAAPPNVPNCIHTPAEFSPDLVELFCRERVRFRFTPDTAFDVIDFDDDNPSDASRARKAFEEWKNAFEQRPGHHDKPEQLIPGLQPGMQQRGF